MKHLLLTIVCLIAWTTLPAQDMRQDTYCNPLNIDYTYMIYNSDRDISYRSGADPAVVEFRGEYYMFVTRSHGYWRSRDLLNWEFVRPGKNWYPQGCNAPAAHNYKDSVLYVAGDPSGSMSILYTDDPASGDWEATPAILHNLQDPDLFIDDDGKAYMFWGSSNVYPIRGMELDKDHRFTKKGETKELFNLDMPKHGWERFGENHTDTVLGGYIEGPWLTKHNGKYYMQYGAPGTEFGKSDNYFLLEVDLKTGRHHQIRCQLAKMGCPIKGDLKYGFARSNPDGSICLHARHISFVHPVSKEMIEVEAPVPPTNLWQGFQMI